MNNLKTQIHKEFDELPVKKADTAQDWEDNYSLIKSFIDQSIDKAIAEARREAWIDGFMESGDGYNGEVYNLTGAGREEVAQLYDRQQHQDYQS